MSFYDDIVSDDQIFREAKKEQLTKDQLLDQNYNKAEKKKEKKLVNKKIDKKKPFLKTGVILLIISILCLIIVNVMPWAYVKCDSSIENNEIEKFIYHYNMPSNIKEREIVNIFETPEVNASMHSSNYIGINFDDFKNSKAILGLGFILLSLMAVIFIFFQLIERSKSVFKNGFMFFHTAFSCMVVIVSFFLFFTLVKFYSVYPLLFYNRNFISSDNIFIFFPVPVIISIVLLILIKASLSIIKIYMRIIREKMSIKEDTKHPLGIHGG